MEQLKQRVKVFAEERNWDQFHSPKNLSMALAGEVGELVEVFQWLKEEETTLVGINEKNLSKVKEELADIFIYVLRIADKLDIDLVSEANKKMDSNTIKYPVELAKDNAIKYNRRDE